MSTLTERFRGHRIGLPEPRQDPDKRNLICLEHDAIDEEPQRVGALRCDRLLHNAHRIVLKGPSRRKEGKLDS